MKRPKRPYHSPAVRLYTVASEHPLLESSYKVVSPSTDTGNVVLPILDAEDGTWGSGLSSTHR